MTTATLPAYFKFYDQLDLSIVYHKMAEMIGIKGHKRFKNKVHAYDSCVYLYREIQSAGVNVDFS